MAGQVLTPSPTTTATCDRCGARAYVWVEFPPGDLLFCAHHGRQAVPVIQQRWPDAVVVDDSPKPAPAPTG